MKRMTRNTVATLALLSGPFWAAQANPSPTTDWTGPYLGISVGYADGWSEHYYDRAGHGRAETDPSGGAFAITGGYNHQFDNGVVLGVEADLGVADISDDTKVIFDDHYYTTEWGDVFGTLRGRVGYAFEDTLVFATAGFGFMDSDEVVVGNTPQEGVSNEQTLTGFAGGLGFERRVWENTSVKLEWVRFAFSETDGVNTGPDGDPEAWSFDGGVDLFRIGVNFAI